MTKLERVEDWLLACTIWLVILTVLTIVVIVLGAGYAMVVVPLAAYDFVRRKLRRS